MNDQAMNQTDLFALVSSMKPGQCVNVTRATLQRCAEADLHFLDRPARDSDIDAFLKMTAENWEFEYWTDPITGGATIKRLGEGDA